MKRNLTQHFITVSATGLACAAILFGNPVSYAPVPGNNGNRQETPIPGSGMQGNIGKPGNAEEISPLNDNKTPGEVPTFVVD